MFKKIPHTVAIIFYLIVFSAMLTLLVPAGEFLHETIRVDGVERNVIVNNSYHRVESNFQTWQIFTALINGFKAQAGIIAFVLIIGGAFQLLNSSKSIDIGILSFLNFTKKLERFAIFKKIDVNNVVIVAIMVLFSLFGGIFGMSEETLAFVIIIVPLAISMGYDSITGVSMVYLAAHVGFSGAMLNPFTIGIAQGLSGIPLFSGIEYRIFCWVIFTAVAIAWVLIYARKIKRNPQKSIMYNADAYWRKREDDASIKKVVYQSYRSTWAVYLFTLIVMGIFSYLHPRTTFVFGENATKLVILPVLTLVFAVLGFFSARKSYHFFNLIILLFTIIFLVVGVLGYHWYIEEISALFLAMGLLSAIAAGFTTHKVVEQFIAGNKDMLTAALIIGFAGGIIHILTDGKVMDTILSTLAGYMETAGKTASLMIMYGIQTVINIFIPSGSAKAALTMPIMSPFSDVVGISRQATIMAYQFGDGFTNMITPTSAILIGALGIAKVPYEVWVKWVYKFILVMMILGGLLLLPTIYMNLPGF